MVANKRSAGVTPEMNLRECVTHMPLPSSNKAAHPGFETQRRLHQNRGISGTTKRTHVLQKFKKKIREISNGQQNYSLTIFSYYEVRIRSVFLLIDCQGRRELTLLLLNIGSIRMNILMLDTRNVEQTKDVRMYIWRIYSSRYRDTLLHKVEVKNIGKILVYIHSQQRIEKCENCS